MDDRTPGWSRVGRAESTGPLARRILTEALRLRARVPAARRRSPAGRADAGDADGSPPAAAARSGGWRAASSGSPRRRPAAAYEQLISALRRDLGGPRVLAFANPKGGVHKTTATVLAAATIGSVRGRGVIAWDDNELRGTLGPAGRLAPGTPAPSGTWSPTWPRSSRSHGGELRERLDDYLRHASDGSYDVLAGEENPRFAQQLDPHTVRRVLELLRRTHDVICVDTGNNVESANWQTVHADGRPAGDHDRCRARTPRSPPTGCSTCCDETGMGELVAERGHAAVLPDAEPVAAARRPGPALRAPVPGRSRSCPTTRRWRAARRSSTPCSQPATRRAWLQAAA